MKKPNRLNVKNASAFKATSVAEAYTHRPPYSAEVYKVLLGLIPPQSKAILDVGCGPGKLGRGLVNQVNRVDAIDFSAEMIRVGRTLPNGDHPYLNWICAPIEQASFIPPYGLIVAGASLHWMDWNIIFPKFVDILASTGHFALISGDEPTGVPWIASRKALIAEYSVIQNYEPFNMVEALKAQGFFQQLGEHRTKPTIIQQPIADFLKADHSRMSLAPELMGIAQATNYDAKLTDILQPYSTNGLISYEVTSRVVWGKPQSNG